MPTLEYEDDEVEELYDITEKKMEIERGSTRSHPVENSLWKRLRTCRKTDYRMNERDSALRPQKQGKCIGSVNLVGTEMASSDESKTINLLECPSCHQTMAPPIFLCEDGHNVCSRCRGEMPNCPSCGSPVTENRNNLAERFAHKLPYPCSNQNMGCKYKSLLCDLPSHEAVCPHRLYCCVPCRPRCRWKGRKFQVLEHMKEEHKELVWVKAYNSLVFENFDYTTDHTCTHILSCYQELFWCHSKRDATRGKLFEVVQFIGRKEKAVKFEYEFEFYSKGNNRTAIFRSRVHSEDDDVEKIYESGDCLVLDLSVLKYFVTEEKQLFYNFKVQKIL